MTEASVFQRYRRNPQPLPVAGRPAASDPWKSAEESRGSDQGVWILSYLDVMMILFAFFVLLFAYQKSLTPSSPRVQKSPGVQAEMQKQAKAEPKTAQSRDVVAKPTPKESANLTVSAMKSQAPLSSLSRAVSREMVSESVPASSPVSARDSVDAAARLATAQTGQWISRALQKETEGKQVEVVNAGRGVRLELSEAILFDPASADLNASGGALLDRVLPVLLQQPGIVYVEGHTDNTPIANTRYPSNWELSTARATAVTRYLIARGISSDRLRAVGMADTHPRAGNEGVEGRARNRRVSLVLGEDQPAR